MIFNVKISLFYRFDESEILKVTSKLLITSMVLFAMVNCDINIVRLLKKAALYLTKIQFGIRTDGRVIEQTENPL